MMSSQSNFPLVEKNRNDSVSVKISNNDTNENNHQRKDDSFNKNPFGDVHNEDFWNEVTNLYDTKGLTWNDYVNRARLNAIVKRFNEQKKDPIVGLITDVYDEYKKAVKEVQELSPFRLQLLIFVKMILEDSYKENFDPEDKELEDHVYPWPIPIPNQGSKTVLHLFAERNLTDLAKAILSVYPNTVYVGTLNKNEPAKHLLLPLQLSLALKFDDVSSVLIDHMYHRKVRNLFLPIKGFAAKLNFTEFAKEPNFKKTIPALLNCMMNGDWPYVPIQKEEDNNKVDDGWSHLPYELNQYHFHYRVLDGDAKAQPARIPYSNEVADEKSLLICDSSQTIANPKFDAKSPSPLSVLLEGPHKEKAVQHPVVRMLIERKWQLFGKRKLKLRFGLYIVFLLSLCLACFVGAADRRSYQTQKDYVRAVFEVTTLIFCLGYFVSEMDQLNRERWNYVKGFFNWLDLAGIFLILVIIPVLRYSGCTKAELYLSAIAFFINFSRVFKYFPLERTVGVYYKTLLQMIRYDISLFLLVYVVVFFTFTGSIYLSAQAGVLEHVEMKNLTVPVIILKEIRALAEGNPFNENYNGFSKIVLVIVMVNMFVLMVILSNLLISQLSYRYANAMDEATVQFSIVKAKFVMHLEQPSIFNSKNERIVHYIDGDKISNETLINDLIEDWRKIQPDEKQSQAIKSFLLRMSGTKPKKE